MKYCLRVDSPVLNWSEGHVLGNGDLGAAVWGHPGELCIGLSKQDVNLLDNSGASESFHMTYPEMVEQVLKGKREFWWKMGGMIWASSEQGPYPLPLGIFSLNLIRFDYQPVFHQELDLRKAEVRTSLTMPNLYSKMLGIKKKTAPIEVCTRVAATANVVLITLHSEDRHTVPFRWTPYSEPRGTKWAVVRGQSNAVSECLPLQDDGHSGKVTFGGACGDVTLILGVASELDDINPRQLAEKMTALEQNELIRTHQAWWKDFWQHSDIEYGDSELNDLWHFGIYALGCSTRPETSPPHLQGIWNLNRIPAWHCDFHFNANLAESQWVAGPANHPELAEALVRKMIFGWRDELRKVAQLYGLPGLAFPLCCDFRGRPLGWTPLSLAMGMTAWMASHLSHWLDYGGDLNFLPEIWDFERECCEFYLAILHSGADDKLHVELTESPEQVEIFPDGSQNIVLGNDATLDLVAIRELFECFLKHSSELKLEDDIVSRTAKALPRLAPLPEQEGYWLDYKTGFFRHGDGPGYFPWSHRHPSRLYPIFPGHYSHIGKNLDIGKKSFAEFRSYSPEHFTGWSLAWQSAIAARLGACRTLFEFADA